jgi:hypothetical protein
MHQELERFLFEKAISSDKIVRDFRQGFFAVTEQKPF